MEVVETYSGKQFICDYFSVIPIPPRMYIRISGTGIEQIASVFSDPEETCKITYGDVVIDGYTQLVAIIPEGNIIRVVLTTP